MKIHTILAGFFFILFSCATSEKMTKKEITNRVNYVINSDSEYLNFYNKNCIGIEPYFKSENDAKGKKLIVVTYPIDSLKQKNKENWWSNEFSLKIIFDSATKEPLYIQDGASGLIRKLDGESSNQ